MTHLFCALGYGGFRDAALLCVETGAFPAEKPNAGHRKTAMRRAFIYKNVGSQGADAQGLSCKTADPRGSAGDRTGGFIRFVYWGAANLETLRCPVGESAALQDAVLHGKTLRYKAAASREALMRMTRFARRLTRGEALGTGRGHPFCAPGYGEFRSAVLFCRKIGVFPDGKAECGASKDSYAAGIYL